MSLRELVVLGNSAEVPTQDRHLNGLFLRWDEHGLLFDPGEGTQRRLIFAEVTATAITGIFLSCFRPAHCLGLAGITQRLSLDRVPQTVPVHFPASGEIFFQRLSRASIFHSAVRLEAVPIEGEAEVYPKGELTVIAKKLPHPVDALGYRIQEADRVTMLPEKLREFQLKGPMIKQLIQDGEIVHEGRRVTVADVSQPRPGQSVAILMTGQTGQVAHELAQGVDLLVVGASYLEADQAKAQKMGVMTAAEAGRLAATAKAKSLVLTSFAPEYRDLTPFRTEAEAFMPKCRLLKSLDRINIPRPPKLKP